MRPIFLAAALALALPQPLAAQSGQDAVQAILAEVGSGTRWGLVVADGNGTEIVAIDPEGRFVPASNTKVFTTAAVMRAVARGEFAQGVDAGTRVRLVPAGKDYDVIIEGRGDPRLSAAADCTVDCLATLADAVAAKTRRVRNVVGDDTAFPDQRWSPGMSWNNMPTGSGTGISALTLDENEIAATVTPALAGTAPVVTANAYYTVENRALTVAGESSAIGYDRAPGSRTLVVTGTIGDRAKPAVLDLGIDDPAHYTAWRFAELLRVRGVAIAGGARALHRPLLPSDDPKLRGGAAPAAQPDLAALATLTPPPLQETLTRLNKVSQNVYAELMLRRLGRISGTGSIADGQVEVAAMLAEAGVMPHQASLSDGSGMSSYNRVAPRGMVRLLQWIARQPWGAAWRATLPVGGIDGTLGRRFKDTTLAGKLSAKTGSLNATNALAGFFIGASGREFTFAFYANDVPEDVKATAIMDRALLAIAASH